MKILLNNILIFLLIFSSCEKKDKKDSLGKLSKTKPELLKRVISSDSYNPKTVCDCNNDGTKLLNKLLQPHIIHMAFLLIESLTMVFFHRCIC